MADKSKQINPHKDHRQRMKRQFLRGGIDQFEPHQVLELLLFYAIPQRDTNPLAHRLLDHFGDLPSVLDADYEELCRIDGISEHSATMLVLCGQLLSRYYKEKKDKRIFSGIREIAEYMQNEFVNEKREKVMLLALNNRLQLINFTVVHTGTLTSSEANTRELVQAALRSRATAVVIAHNHPAGFCAPSVEDVATTRALISAFQMMDITLLDHVIYAMDGSFSMRESPYHAAMFSKTVQRMDRNQVNNT